jgi:hypothetical protein
MSIRPLFLLLPLVATLVAPSAVVSQAAPSAAPVATSTAFTRVELRPVQGGKALPYTIEIPTGWQVRQVEGFPGLFLGPADAKPPEDPRLVWVRGSRVSMAKPDEVASTIRANDAKAADWAAPRLEVREVGGLRGILVRMDSGEGEQATSSLTLKLPFTGQAIDFMAKAPRAEFERRLPLYERILLSVRFVGAP